MISLTPPMYVKTKDELSSDQESIIRGLLDMVIDEPSIESSLFDLVSFSNAMPSYQLNLYFYKIQLIHIVDGDTLRGNIDLGFHTWLHNITLRLLGIDAPEHRGAEKQAGKTATQFLVKLLEGKELFVRVQGQGKFGRWLAEVFFEEDGGLVCVNEMMVKEGMAKRYW